MTTGSGRPAGAIETLYEADFYAWTQRQAALLRAGDLDNVDLNNILEEIETLGRKEVSELRSRLRIVLAHLLKQVVQPERSTRSWAVSILHQRIAIADHMKDNPSLKSKLAQVFTDAFEDGRELAAVETGLALKIFPPLAPFSCDQALSKSWVPPEISNRQNGRKMSSD